MYTLYIRACSLHFWYTLCIRVYMLLSFLVYTLHLDIYICSFHTLWVYSLGVYTLHLGIVLCIWVYFWYTYTFIWVYSFHSGIFIWVCTLHLSMHALSFWYTLFIWVCSFHLGIHFSFGYANTLQRATQLCLHRTTPSEHDFLINAHPSGRAKRSPQSVPFSIFLL